MPGDGRMDSHGRVQQFRSDAWGRASSASQPANASPATIGPSVSAAPLGSGDEATCENTDVGYRVTYPAD